MTSRTSSLASIDSAVEALEREVPDARGGLPDSVFYLVSRLTPLINVDLLVVNERHKKLLTWRHDRLYGPGWHVPGGIIRFKESWETRIQAVAHQELGAHVGFLREPVSVFPLINPQRDVRGHFISLVFQCWLETDLPAVRQASSNEVGQPGQWQWFDQVPANMIAQQMKFKSLINHQKYTRI